MENGLGFWCHIECQRPIGSRSFCEIIGTTLIRVIEWGDTGTRIAYRPREEARDGTSHPPTEGTYGATNLRDGDHTLVSNKTDARLWSCEQCQYG